MQALQSHQAICWQDQWNAYQIRAFGPQLDVLLHRIELLTYSPTAGAAKIAGKLALCCKNPVIITVDEGRRYYLAETRCRSRVCPRCSRFRARQLAVRIAAIVRRMDAPRFLTLTIRSTDRPLAEQVKHLRRRFAAMRRRPEWRQHVRGGVYTIEITHNPKTDRWHPHLHAIIDGIYWPHDALLGLWTAIVRDHAGVDIRAVHGVRKLANYLAAYVAKSCDLSKLATDQLAEWAVETHGLRLAQTFGSLQKCKPQTDDLEPLPTRMVEIDVNDLAYHASCGLRLPEQLLTALEPCRGARPDQNPGEIMMWIHEFNNPLPSKPKRPRVRDPDQLYMLN